MAGIPFVSRLPGSFLNNSADEAKIGVRCTDDASLKETRDKAGNVFNDL